MKRSDLNELHYIVPIDNVPSIMERGILCNARVQSLNPVSVADPEVQRRRERRRIPGGLPLHAYVNLYLTARNPMLYRRQAQHSEPCVLRVSTAVLDLPGTVIADGNAAIDYTAFRASPSGLEAVDGGLVFAEYWTDPDHIMAYRRKRVKCAEVLVPEVVASDYIEGIYVSCQEAKEKLLVAGVTLPIEINPHLFFRA